ncbi:hypothetical protein TNCV_3915421, partial [Trichonephila clavipes]
MSVFRKAFLTNRRHLTVGSWHCLLSQQATSIAKNKNEEKLKSDKPSSQLSDY